MIHQQNWLADVANELMLMYNTYSTKDTVSKKWSKSWFDYLCFGFTYVFKFIEW